MESSPPNPVDSRSAGDQHASEASLVLQAASVLDTVPRFYHLLPASKSLLQAHGPYTLEDTPITDNVFSRGVGVSSADDNDRIFAASLAAAQDSLSTQQSTGLAGEDLEIFKLLWNTTIEVLDKILDSGALDRENFGWGVHGLCAGYSPASASFISYKTRLYAALTSLPSLSSEPSRAASLAVPPANRVHTLVAAKREVHTCGTMLMQTIKADWTKVRWYHTICIADKWLRSLGWEKGI